MMNILRTSAAIAVLALTATPALAAPVGPDRQATATARIIKPLVLTWEQDLDLGTIMLSGAGVWAGAVVGVSQAGAPNCTNTNVTCSGTMLAARYNVAGTQGQVVNISAPNVTMVNQNDNTRTLLLTVSAPASVTLANSGVPGNDFSLGGSITVASDTLDGVYLGTFNVTVDY